MKHIAPIVTALGFVGILAAGCNQSEASPARGGSAAQAVKGGAKAETDDFSVELRPVGTYKKDEEGTMEVVIVAKGDKHINDQYPFKFAPKPSDDIESKGPTGRDGGTFEEKKAILRAKFTPKKTGDVVFAGKVSLSVCSDKNCLMEKRDLDITVTVQ